MSKLDEAMALLETGIDQLKETDAWKNYLVVQSNFHGYSFQNALLIYLQNPDATQVAGFQKWKKLNRFVKKGEHGIMILAPRFKKMQKDESKPVLLDENDKEAKRSLVGFLSVSVFDISQTDGAPLADRPYQMIMPGDTAWYTEMKKACPFVVTEAEENALRGAYGDFNRTSKLIRIREGMPEATKAKVLAHEWAHGLLHGLDKERPDRSTRELEAESTAFVVMQSLGFDTSDISFGYIADWCKGEEDIKAVIRGCGSRIQKAASTILGTVQPALGVLEEAV